MSGSHARDSATGQNGNPGTGAPPATGGETSMEDILASIRRILSEEDPPAGQASAEQSPDVLLLDSTMLVADAATPSPVHRTHPLPETILVRTPMPPPPPILPLSSEEEEAEPVASELEEMPAEPVAPPDVSVWEEASARFDASEAEPAPEAVMPAVAARDQEGALGEPEVDAPLPLGPIAIVSPEIASPEPPLPGAPIKIQRPITADPIPALTEPPSDLVADTAETPPTGSSAYRLPASPVLVPVPRRAAAAPVPWAPRPVAMSLEIPAQSPRAMPAISTPNSETPAMSASLSSSSQYSGGGIASPETASAAAGSVTNLVRALTTDRSAQVHSGGPTIADLVREEMRPMLKAWLDSNLPPLVERLVRAEIERVISRAAD